MYILSETVSNKFHRPSWSKQLHISTFFSYFTHSSLKKLNYWFSIVFYWSMKKYIHLIRKCCNLNFLDLFVSQRFCSIKFFRIFYSLTGKWNFDIFTLNSYNHYQHWGTRMSLSIRYVITQINVAYFTSNYI